MRHSENSTSDTNCTNLHEFNTGIFKTVIMIDAIDKDFSEANLPLFHFSNLPIAFRY